MPAVMAGDGMLGPVQHERDVALRALPDLAARPAGEEVRPAAPVEQQDRLACVAQRAARVGVQRVTGAAHVEHLHGRQRPAADALESVSRASRCQLSGRGVADPASSRCPDLGPSVPAPSIPARHSATRRAS
jgi:hypothetical protein